LRYTAEYRGGDNNDLPWEWCVIDATIGTTGADIFFNLTQKQAKEKAISLENEYNNYEVFKDAAGCILEVGDNVINASQYFRGSHKILKLNSKTIRVKGLNESYEYNTYPSNLVKTFNQTKEN